MKKLIALLLAVLMVIGMAACAGSGDTPAADNQPAQTDAPAANISSENNDSNSGEAAQPSENAAPAASGDVTPRTVADRADAPDGVSLTPASYTEAQVPGVPYVGAIPAKQYKIAFCNGDMANEWRAAFYNDMIACLEYLNSEFGIEYITANSGADSAKQLQDIYDLLAQEPDILIFSPNESTPLAPVGEACEELGIPYITVDRAIDAPVGEGQYVMDIEGDNVKCGVAMGIEIVSSLTEKYGEPKGKIAEISGTAGASPGIQRSVGIRMVLEKYPNIEIVQVLAGDFDAGKAYDNAQDILTAHPDIDGLVCAFDSGTMRAMSVAEAMGLNDLMYWSADGESTFLRECVLTGKAECCVEYPPFYGITALEYAIHYLNGYNVPSTVLLAQRLYTIETPEKKAALEEISAKCQEAGDVYPPASYGMYDVFTMEGELWDQVYPKNWVDAGGIDYLNTLIPEDPFYLVNHQ